MPVAPKFIAAWLWSWENSSCNTRREVEGWPEQESLCSVWSHHPIPAHQAIFLFHPILILRFFSNGFTFILLSISSSHFCKHLAEFPPSNDAFCTFYRLINESTSYLPSWFTNCWIIPAILATMWRNQRAVFLFSLRQAWPGQTGDNNSERSGYATQALAAHHHPAPDTTGLSTQQHHLSGQITERGGGHKVYPGNIVYTIGLQHIRFCRCNSTMIQKLRKGGEKEAPEKTDLQGCKNQNMPQLSLCVQSIF